MEWLTLWDLLIEIGGHRVHSLHTQAAPSEETNTSLMYIPCFIGTWQGMDGSACTPL